MGHAAVAEKLFQYNSQCNCCEKKGTNVKLNACSQCRSVFYCSAACQKQDWKQHKQACSPSEADDDEEKASATSPQCEGCQQKATATAKLSVCTRCKATYYCSVACQKQDWKQHKKTCTAAAANKA
jgi:hypothetical protein